MKRATIDVAASQVESQTAGARKTGPSRTTSNMKLADNRSLGVTMQRIQALSENSSATRQLREKAEIAAASPVSIRMQSDMRMMDTSPHLGQQTVLQRIVDPEWGGNQLHSFAWIYAHPGDLLYGNYGDIWGWISKAESGNETIEAARAVVEDDEEEAELDVLEGNLDYAVEAGNQAVVAFNVASFDDRPAIARDLLQVRLYVNQVVNELNFYYRPGGHGFGAVGRATEVEGREVRAGARVGAPLAADRFLSNSTLDGTPMTNTHHVGGGVGHAHVAGPISILVNGEYLDENAVRTAGMVNAVGGLAAPAAQQKAAPDDFFARDRGDGQAGAMANTNARGYGWLHQIPGWNETRWEWLHLRAAGLSGYTISSNLVLGTRDANTQMMPYESNMRALQTIARASANYTGVVANWSADGGNQPHACNRIRMTWAVPRTQQGAAAGLPVISGQVDIHPLTGGEVLSKAEVRHIEDALRTVRDAANPDMDMSD